LFNLVSFPKRKQELSRQQNSISITQNQEKRMKLNTNKKQDVNPAFVGYQRSAVTSKKFLIVHLK